MSISEIRNKLVIDLVNSNFQPINDYLKILGINFSHSHLSDWLIGIYSKQNTRNILQGYKQKVIHAGFLYVYCFLVNQKCTQKEIQKVTGVSLVSIRKIHKTFMPIIYDTLRR